MTRNDIYWKGLIENLFSHFIPFFLPQYTTLFDLTRPVEFLDKELQQLYPATSNNSDIRFVDKLVKVFANSGEEKWVLIHIEVQGYNDTAFAQRMHQYFYRILDRYGVAVTAIAIFTDTNPAFQPSHYAYEFAGTEMIYRFNTYKVLQQDEQQLLQSNNPFAMAILTVLLALKKNKLNDDSLLKLKTGLVKQLYTKGFAKQIIRHLLDFITVYVNFAKPETAIKFDKAIDLITNNATPMGIREQIIEISKQEGKLEGRLEGEQKAFLERNTLFVENLLRHSDFTDERIAFLAGVTQEFVRQTREKLHL